MSLSTLPTLSLSSLSLTKPKTNSTPYGYTFLFSQLVKNLPEIFLTNNYREEFLDHPEQAGSLRRLLNPEAYVQLEKLLGIDKLLALNGICSEDQEVFAHTDILTLAVELEGGVHHGLALSLYQAIAAQGGDTEARATKFYETASGGGSWAERFQYNARHFGNHTTTATVMGLMTGITIGAMFRYGGLSLLQRSSGFFNATRLGGQSLAKSVALGAESFAVVAADQGTTQLLTDIRQNWSMSHLFSSSVHMAGRLLLIKAANFATNRVFYGVQGINPVLGARIRLSGLKGLGQRLVQPVGLTGGMYLGPHADYLINGTYNLGEGHGAIDAMFGAVALSMAGSLSHLITPRAVQAKLQSWNQQSLTLMQRQFSQMRMRLAQAWHDSSSGSRLRESFAGLGEGIISTSETTLATSIAQPLGAKWSAQMTGRSSWKWPGWRALFGRRSPKATPIAPAPKPEIKILTPEDVGSKWPDYRAERRFVAEYRGQDEAGNTHWQLRLRPGAKMGLPNICCGPSFEAYRFAVFTLTARDNDIAILYQWNPVVSKVKPFLISQRTGEEKLFGEGALFFKPGDILVLPEGKVRIELEFLTPKEQSVAAEVERILSSDQTVAPLPELKDHFALGPIYLPDTYTVVFQAAGRMQQLDLSFTLESNDQIRVEAYQTMGSKQPKIIKSPSDGIFYNPLVDQKGQPLNEPLILNNGEHTLLLRPLARSMEGVENYYVKIPIRIGPLSGISLEPKAIQIEVAELAVGQEQEGLPDITPVVERNRDAGEGNDKTILRGHSSWFLFKAHSERQDATNTKIDPLDVSRLIQDFLTKGEGNLELHPNYSSFDLKKSFSLEIIPRWPQVTLGVDSHDFRRALAKLSGKQKIKFSWWGWGNRLLNPEIQAGGNTFHLKTITLPQGSLLRKKQILMVSLDVMNPRPLSTQEAMKAYEALFAELGFREVTSVSALPLKRD